MMFAILVLIATTSVQAARFNINVVDGNGAPIPTDNGFRWMLQEDTTYAMDPSSPAPLIDQQAFNFHKSHHPIARHNSGAVAGQGLKGNVEGATTTVTNLAPGRYYLSVLPYDGYALGGAPVTVLPNSQDPGNVLDDVTVVVEEHPIPTAQISVFLFHDCFPLNGAPDLPEEQPGSGSCTPSSVDFSQFGIILEEPAGKYGANGGPMLQDAFGNPLGTAYQNQNPDTPYTGPGGCPAREDGSCADGTLFPNSDGMLIIKNLAPGKYGLIPSPAAGWIQTSTIEGSPVIDAWVKANEPPFMVEFGLPGPHVFIGFTQERNDLTDGAALATVSGQITDMHMSRPPATQLYSGRPFPQCWIAINENSGVPGLNRYAMPCSADSSFSIPNVPAGSYEMKVFDTPLDVVIATMTFTVDPNGTCNGGQSCNFGEVPVFNWFNRLTTYIFNDANQDGFWDANEGPLGAESGPVNIRWRDGTVYQSFPTDFEGVAPFDEDFPFFHWMVAEVGFTNKKATGATIVVDAGGVIDKSSDLFPGFGELTPQVQDAINTHTGDALSRTEIGPVLTQAFQGFLGQTNVIQFGKTDYLAYTPLDFSTFPPQPPRYVGENGGISGIVFNSVTRAENDPQFAVGETWEPGVPRVQVNLYADGDIDAPAVELDPVTGQPIPATFPDGIGDIDWDGDGTADADDNLIDDIDGDGQITLADVDNYPLGWAEGGAIGAEDIDRNGNGLFDLGDAVAVAWTDSWDDNTPSNCQGQNSIDINGDNIITADEDSRCFDGMRNWNQVRPGVFDGGYAFSEYDLAHLGLANPAAANKIQAFYDHINTQIVTPEVAATLQLGLLPGDYIVEATTPPGYEALREHHKNVDFGDDYQPALQALPPVCVGPEQVVPELFAISTKDGSGDPAQIVPGITLADAAAPFAGQPRPVCDMKKINLAAAQNAAADFFLVSDVPVAANISGMILNDLANEFNPNSPNFGEKYAPPQVPVGIYDWNGKQVNRVYADEYGMYNAMVPSTWSANLPQPSGMSPNMLVACMNDAGPIPDPDNPGERVVDPYFNPAFSQFCYTFQYMPGSTTYLDTPVVPVAAFASPVSYPVDCAVPHRTPMIRSVENTTRGIGPMGVPGDTLVVTSMGNERVPNPAWDGVDPATRLITRNRNFGGNPGVNGRLELVDANGVRTQLSVSNASWSPTRITADIPTLPPGEYQVVVTRGNGVPTPVESEIGVTLTVGELVGGQLMGLRENGQNYAVLHVPLQYPTINQAIDAADAGDMVMVGPGIYDELVIMWKPVKLQGWGAGKVTINARQSPTEKVMAWRDRIAELTDGNLANGEFSVLPGQGAGAGGVFQALGAPTLPTEEGAGVFVAGIDTTTPNNAGGRNRFNIRRNRGARIDGFSIVGASQGGGIVVNGYAPFLNIGNNNITTNSGFYGGGIRVGHPLLTNEDTGTLTYTDAMNDRIRIHHNLVVKNGGTAGAGGGISLLTGADQYRVQDNWVCGNFSQGNGGGIAHMGLSNGGRIERNDILFNESFSQANAVNGGGVFIGGQTPLAAAGLSKGSGNVLVDANRIHGNMAGAGDGGGIAVVNANGMDIVNSRIDNSNRYRNGRWWDVSIFNNMITNNVSGLAGALSFQDSLEVHVRHNTIAHNDSTATVALAFTPGFPNQSNAQPAGVVSRLHSPVLGALLASMNPNSVPANGNRLDEYLSFSDADLINNIVFGNRSFFWLNYDDPLTTLIETGLFPANCTTAPTGCDLTAIADYSDDMAVMDGVVNSGEVMFSRFNLLTDNADNTAEYTGGGNVFTADPQFLNPVFNEGQGGINIPEFTVIQTAGAFDEGGNFIQVAFGPLTLVEPGTAPNARSLFDYHIDTASPAVGAGRNVGLAGRLGRDIDGDPRSNNNTNEIGADELP